MAMLGLPAPVLRQPANQDVKVLDDEDEDEDDSDNGNKEQGRNGNGSGASEGPKQDQQVQHHNHNHNHRQQPKKVDILGGKAGGGVSRDRRPLWRQWHLDDILAGRPAEQVAPVINYQGVGAGEAPDLTLSQPVSRFGEIANKPLKVNSSPIGQGSDVSKRRQAPFSAAQHVGHRGMYFKTTYAVIDAVRWAAFVRGPSDCRAAVCGLLHQEIQ
ncbi:hypothetical protein Vretifemale_5486 [Volvox reticuliferus]|uniref:Uncharacterized protein n=1 Tax=Volvox reticuliferus TaxID=1737510 RepID=A0A8J4C588_9CHLO|nr:hypothetical protein Vretifemale_5486 [Volvox reticuliferus]